MKKILAILIVLIPAVGVIVAVIYMNGKQGSPVSDNHLTSVTAGKQLYLQHCASCHGINLEGQPNWRSANADGTFPAPPHDETGHTWHHDDETIFNYIKYGGAGIARQLGLDNPNSGMPAYDDSLSDAEIIDIINYIKSTWSQKLRVIQSSINAG